VIRQYFRVQILDKCFQKKLFFTFSKVMFILKAVLLSHL